MAALLACLCLLPDMAAHAQSPPRKVVVNGRVADESGDPVAGATIVERGTSNGSRPFRRRILDRRPARCRARCLVSGVYRPEYRDGNRTEFEIVLQEDVKAIAR